MTSKATGKKTFWAWTLATAFGAGFGKPGPGTWGSAVAVIVWLVVGALTHASRAAMGWGTLAAIIVVTLIGIPAATRVEQEAGRHDPGFVVLDEVVGQWTVLIGCTINWPHAVVGFVLFRLFDITKPWPVRKLEKLPGGTGIMLDDVAAGVLGLIVMQILLHWW